MLSFTMATSDSTALKRAVAAKALDYVTEGMRLGLGTGSTAEAFVDILGLKVRNGLKVTCAATSEHIASKARSLGITLSPLDDLAPLDLTIDGADEADRNLDLIKGGGGALLREKIVAASSKRMIVIADESKLVSRLGKYPLPVEVVEFGHLSTHSRLRIALADLGYQNIEINLRSRDGKTFRSDNNNLIYDCALGAIPDARKLAAAISGVPGVVDHGLFIGIATMLLISHPGEIETIERS